MDNERELTKILETLVDPQLNSKISTDAYLTNDLGLDSIRILMLFIELGKIMNFDIIKTSEQVDISKIKKVGDVLNLINEYQE